ncbi:unnamed protein product [Protopolystoma xenopodis]|uniref:Uncharacterized protein n=1 Tax=Protopolystoma xenopodis TaxID=117903 RepID=A0A448WK56_9PLAT|nr:unnamed protein product [Protopolystoma xenopodis]
MTQIPTFLRTFNIFHVLDDFEEYYVLESSNGFDCLDDHKDVCHANGLRNFWCFDEFDDYEEVPTAVSIVGIISPVPTASMASTSPKFAATT